MIRSYRAFRQKGRSEEPEAAGERRTSPEPPAAEGAGYKAEKLRIKEEQRQEKELKKAAQHEEQQKLRDAKKQEALENREEKKLALKDAVAAKKSSSGRSSGRMGSGRNGRGGEGESGRGRFCFG